MRKARKVRLLSAAVAIPLTLLVAWAVVHVARRERMRPEGQPITRTNSRIASVPPEASNDRAAEAVERRADPDKADGVSEVLDEMSRQYGHAGNLDWDDARALVAKRKGLSDALVDRLSSLGPGGALAIAGHFAAASGTRAKLLLVRALGEIPDSTAPVALEGLLAVAPTHSVRREIVVALGKRPEARAIEALGRILQSEQDPRLRIAAVQALSGRPEAMQALTLSLAEDADTAVRIEAIRSIGLIGDDGARSALTDVAVGEEDVSIRMNAIQELARSFPEACVAVLGALLDDSEPRIRLSVVDALRRLPNAGGRLQKSG